MKSIIIYGSHHHGNTKKLVEKIAGIYHIETIDAEEVNHIDLSSYDLIGFASGIDFGKFYPAVTNIAETLPTGKHIYALFTCAQDNGKYGNQIKAIAENKGCIFLGKYGCKGYNTYGPWKIIGGMNKKHPTQREIDEAVEFYKKISKIVKEKLENNEQKN